MATLRTQYIPPKGRSKLLKDLNLTSANISIEGLGGGPGGGDGTSWLELYFEDTPTYINALKEIRWDNSPLTVRESSMTTDRLTYWNNGKLATTNLAPSNVLSRNVNEEVTGLFTFKRNNASFYLTPSTAGTAYYIEGRDSSTAMWRIGAVSAASNLDILTTSDATSGAIRFLTNGQLRMSIAKTGMISLGNVTGDTYLIQLTPNSGSVYTLMVKAREDESALLGGLLSNNTINWTLGKSGTTSNDVRLLNHLNAPLIFGTNNAVRGRFTADGNFIVGTSTSSSYKLYVQGTGRFTSALQSQTDIQGFQRVLVGQSSQPFASWEIQGSDPTYYAVQRLLSNLSGFQWKTDTTLLMQLLSTGSLTIGNSTTKVGHTTIYGNLTVSNPTSLESTLSVTGNATMSAKLYVNNDIKHPSYISGWTGSQFGYDFATKTLEVDNLSVRKMMRVYELVINQIRGVNGSLIVSDTAKVATVTNLTSTSWSLYVETGNDNNLIPFINGDVVICRKWVSAGIKYYKGTISNINFTNKTFTLTRTEGSSTPEPGDVLARVNSSDSNRKGYLYLTSVDTNAPYMDVVYDNVVKARLGRLNGITDPDMGTLTGYGLYADNVYLKGKIWVTGGNAATQQNIDDSINNIEIGGRNLVEKTNQGITNIQIDSSAGSGTWTASEEIVDGVRCAKGTKNTTAVETWALFNLRIYTPSKFRANQQYTISFKMKPSFALNDQVTRLSTNTNQGLSTNSDTYSLVAGEWNHIKLVVTTLPDFDTILAGRATVHLRLGIDGNSSTGDTVLLKDIKIEEGNKATDWSPAPEDIDALATQTYNNSVLYTNSYVASELSSFSAALGDLAWLNLIGLSKLDNTVIEGGYIKTTLLNATYIRSSIINTSYIEGLTLNFAQGTIGNWRIGGDLLYSGLLSSNNIYAAASVGVFLKSNHNSSTPASSTPAIVIKGTNVENTLVRLYINNSSNWGIQGLVGNVTYFHLGSYNRIAGWNFTDTTLSSQTLVGGVPVMELNSFSRELTIRSSSTKYVRMFYSSASVFGLEHYDNGTRLFQLGSTNQIAGWQLYNNYIVSSNGALRMHQTDGFIIYGATTTPSTHGTALVNSRIRMYYSASNDWGLKGYNSSGVAVFELGSTNRIAGINFDNQKLWSSNNNWEINSNGSVKFTSGQIGGFAISNSGLVNDDNTAYIICRNNSQDLDARIGASVFPASSGVVGLGYFYNRTTLSSNLYGIYIDTMTSSDSSLYFSCALYAANRKEYSSSEPHHWTHYAASFVGQVRIDSGNLIIYNGKVMENNVYHSITLNNVDYNYLPVGKARVFVLSVGGSSYSIMRLPTVDQIRSQLNNTTYSHNIMVTIHVNATSTQSVRIQTNSGNLYNNAGNTVSYIALSKGDSITLINSGSNWQVVHLTT
jgi:hypothetical protein